MAELIDVTAPAEQEGTQSTVARWLKEAGDSVAEHEPLVELETDKVTVEVPAPANGVLKEIVLEEQAEVQPGDVLCRIEPGDARVQSESKPPSTGGKEPRTSARAPARLSPAVRKLLEEHDLDPADVKGTGRDGRISHQDVLDHLAARESSTSVSETGGGESASRRVPHSAMRKRIAAHMVQSTSTAPHVTAVFEADLSSVLAHRARNRDTLAADGTRLTLTAYFVQAAIAALKKVPEANASFHDDALEIFEDYNIGVGIALENEGLIVPVLHRAQDLDLAKTAVRLQELTKKARAGKLAPEEVRGGTFTISNHGVSGSLIAAPIIINQPQTAILGIGKLEKRAVVVEKSGGDAIEMRPRCYVTLTIDHRALDGYQANAFLTRFVVTLENWAA
ncbi:2-oxo acid dehydrogenase subunit E2 [soil metagenome]